MAASRRPAGTTDHEIVDRRHGMGADGRRGLTPRQREQLTRLLEDGLRRQRERHRRTGSGPRGDDGEGGRDDPLDDLGVGE
jgi:hypothetical protein